MIGNLSEAKPSIHPIKMEEANKIFEEDSDVERLVDEVLLEQQQGNTTPFEVIDVNLSSSGAPFELAEHDTTMGDNNFVMVSSDELMNDSSSAEFDEAWDVLCEMGVEAFLQEQMGLQADPCELYEIFELDLPMIPEGVDNGAFLWQHLRKALEEVLASCLSDSEGMIVISDDEEMQAAGKVEASEEHNERVSRANAFLLELRQKGPLQFAEDHDAAGTSASIFLSDISCRLPSSMLALSHHDQWSFIRRFLIKYVYQRPRLSHLTTLDHALECIRHAKKILIVTGAGISVSCGIPDFRSENGLYSIIRGKYALPEPECMFDIEYFRDDPAPFYMLAKVSCNFKIAY